MLARRVPPPSPPPPLCVLIATTDPARIAAALRLALAHAALGGEATLYFDEVAVPAMTPALDLSDLLEMGVRIIVCQTGATAAAVDFAVLPPAIEAGGLVSLLAETGTARLVVF